MMTNKELADKLRDLYAYLVIVGYDPSHATRYPQIARSIEKLSEPVEVLLKEKRLEEIPKVGKLIAMYIRELMETGTCSKIKDFEYVAPFSVSELTHVPGIGPMKAKLIFELFGAKSFTELKELAVSGKLQGVPGITPAMVNYLTQA